MDMALDSTILDGQLILTVSHSQVRAATTFISHVPQIYSEPMKIKSMGCYSNANWVLEGARILNNNQTVCAKHCAENFFGLSGVSNSIFCSCGSQLNASAAQADASKCSVKCPEQNELCGGTSEIQVSENIFA